MIAPSLQPTRREKLAFRNQDGESLDALLERPVEEPVAYALFAHCFTCGKDIAAASRVARALAELGFGVLRFDFTGLGGSGGDFGNSNFSSNVQDLVCAADFLRGEFQAPALLVGHSLGGTAVLSAAGRIPEARAVVTIGAPGDPAHVRRLFLDQTPEIESRGCALVTLAGRKFEIRQQFLEDIEEQRLADEIRGLRRALLVMHSPTDTIVDIENATSIFTRAMHPKSFVSLDKADHLLSRRADADYVARTIAAWAGRYVLEEQETDAVPPGTVLVRETDGKFGQEVLAGRHRMRADEPESYGGADAGPSPYDFLMAALGTCTSMTMRMYANHKKLPVDRIAVRMQHEKIHAEDCQECESESGKIDRIDRELYVEGDLTSEQREAIMRIADKCPVHRTLHAEVSVRTRLAEDGQAPDSEG